jgi:type VII secretion-associated serine protease mycosin
MLGRRGRRTMLATCVAGAVAIMPSAPAAVSVSAAASVLAAGAVSARADSVRDSQGWVLGMLHVPDAWSITKGKDVTVAVIDSGVRAVTDLNEAVVGSQDFTELDTKPGNPRWGEHGTWMASIIAGHTPDGANGFTGIAPEAKILSIRVIPDRNDPHYGAYDGEPEKSIQDSLAKGIRYAVDNGAKVISMSIGYSAPSGVVRAALQYAAARGAVLIASSGNSGQNDQHRAHGLAPVSFPAEYPGVLSVGAVGRDGKAAGFSSNNLSVQVAAPGVHVPAQGRDSMYWTVDGTSPACALVAGVAALIVSKYHRLSPALVLQALTTTARNPGGGGYNPRTGLGFGIVDAAAALSAAGKLMKVRPAGSQVASSASFGGGPGAVPAPPVPPRGVGALVLFTMLAFISLVLAGGAVLVLRAARRPRGGRPGSHAAGSRSPNGNGPGHQAGQGRGPGYRPGEGYPVPGTEQGTPHDRG